MSFSQIATSVSILSSGLKSYQAISLTNFVTSAESIIAAGSAIEVANAFFLADGNITPNASSWTAVGTGNTAYLTVLPSGSAGVQILSAAYTVTAPVWSLSKGAWYASAGSLTRYIGGVYKTSATQYDRAFLLNAEQNNAAYSLRPIPIEIGTWDMTATAGSVVVAHGVDLNAIRTVDVVIRHDAAESTRPLNYSPGSAAVSGYFALGLTNITLFRVAGRSFDNSGYNSMGDDGNRGWITVWLGP